VYPVIGCGAVVGFVAAIMGVGGGFLTFPIFVYGLGVSTFTTVGTDILQIIFTTCYSSICQYGDPWVRVLRHCHRHAARVAGGRTDRRGGDPDGHGRADPAFYALTILAGFANRACALRGNWPTWATSRSRGQLRCSSSGLAWSRFSRSSACLRAGYWWSLPAVCRVAAQRAGEVTGPGCGWIVDRRTFRLGVVGLGSFVLVLAVLAALCSAGGAGCGGRPVFQPTGEGFGGL